MVDARGLACPIPVLMTQKELAKGAASVEVMVDNFAARENVTRLAESKGSRPTATFTVPRSLPFT